MAKKIIKDIDRFSTGCIAVLLSLVSGFIFWMYSPNTLIPIYSLVITIFICFCICIMFYAFLHGQKKEIVYRLPRIINFLKDRSLLIVEDSDLLSQDLLSTISYYDEERDVETYVGIGIVQTKNKNNFFQVKFLQKEGLSEDSIFLNIVRRKQYDLLVIRPGIHRDEHIHLLEEIN